jgi:hypothetical protein
MLRHKFPLRAKGFDGFRVSMLGDLRRGNSTGFKERKGEALEDNKGRQAKAEAALLSISSSVTMICRKQ